jgi:glutamine synthetase
MNLRPFDGDDATIDFLDLLMIDIHGGIRHVSVPSGYVSDQLRAEGIGFDASNLGFAKTSDSDMVAIPDMATAFVREHDGRRVVHALCDVELTEGGSFAQYPRTVTRRTVEHLRTEGIADDARMLVELEFHVFDDVRYGSGLDHAFYEVHSAEGLGPGFDELPRFATAARLPPHRATGPLRDRAARRRRSPDRDRHPRQVPPPRGLGRPARDRARPHPARAGRRRRGPRQVAHPQHRRGARAARDVHAEAAVRRRRQRHARPPVPRARWPDAVRGRRPVRAHRPRPGVHRRPARAQPERIAAGVHQPVDQLLPPPGPGFEAPVGATFARASREASVRVPATSSRRSAASSTAPAMRRRTRTTRSARWSSPAPTASDGARTRWRSASTTLATARCSRCRYSPRSTAWRATTATLLPAFPSSLIELWIRLKRQEAERVYRAPTPQEYELYFNV